MSSAPSRKNSTRPLRTKSNSSRPAVVFGELMPQFKGNEKQVAEFLSDHRIAIEPLDTPSVSAASKSWLKYLRRKEKIVRPNRSQFFLPGDISGWISTSAVRFSQVRRYSDPGPGHLQKYFPDLAGYAELLIVIGDG